MSTQPKQHKAGCLINVQCAVVHSDGICPGPYGKCTCPEPPKEPQECKHGNKIGNCGNCELEPKEDCMQISKDAMAKEEWEDEFSRKIITGSGLGIFPQEEELINRLKQFISEQITQAEERQAEMAKNACKGAIEFQTVEARAEERKKVLGEVRERIERMENSIEMIEMEGKKYTAGFNQARRDILLSILKELK